MTGMMWIITETLDVEAEGLLSCISHRHSWVVVLWFARREC
jgi:hypothetical protein